MHISGGDMTVFDTGMFGGKFMPLHKGHEYCIEVASKECRTVYAILFFAESKETIGKEYLSPEHRWERLCALCRRFDNVIPARIDTTRMLTSDGKEDWDRETPEVLRICGRLDAVYSSEPSYGEYFARAYPGAIHRIVDAERKTVPISGTMIRGMDEKERMRWII